MRINCLIYTIVLLIALANSSYSQGVNRKLQRPNILVIMTDQQNASMMSAAGNKWLHTPAMDALAAEGIRFKRTYVTNPVCSPSRFSIMTGQYPSLIGIRENTTRGIDTARLTSLIPRSLGHVFRDAGYETIYGGKAHLPGMQYANIEPWGFDRLTLNERDSLAQLCAAFLEERKGDSKPFLLFASFINPHDICANAILYAGLKPDVNLINSLAKEGLKTAKQIPDGVSEQDFFDKYCPPLPANHLPMINETSEVDRFVKKRPFQHVVREQWTEKDWRMHRWAYMRLVERADAQIGIVMNALKKSGLADNTIVIFTSDHGEHAGAHKLEHKTMFYEESSNVPFIIMHPTMKKKGLVDDEHVVNNGLDLLPTLCDFAGIKRPAGLEGRSLLPIVRNEKNTGWRKYTIIENEIGFMIHTGRYKYELDDKGDIREMFVDLKADPGETRNLINEHRYKKTIGKLRSQLLSHLNARGIIMNNPVARK